MRVADSPDRVSSSQAEGWDAVVTTLVLCSVPDLAACLEDIHGRLRPGGRLFFIEHVLAEDLPGVMLWQQRLQPVWSWCCGNCHLTRRTEESIAAAGFEFETLCRDRLRGAPAVVQTVIRGIARKPY